MNLTDKPLRALPVTALLVATAISAGSFKTLAAALHRASLDTDASAIEVMTCSR